MTKELRNIAIIAHVDHGKTTLVDAMLRQSGTFRANQQITDRVMDSNDLERERGITILSKNTSVHWGDVKINIVDTPGHADFGGEVERVLKMVNGVLLVVDAFEGPMPQTRFVLSKAFELKLTPIVVINKVDRPLARPTEIVDELLDLFLELGAAEDQIDFPIIYASAIQGIAGDEPAAMQDSMQPLFDAIIKHIPPPQVDATLPLQLLVTTLDYDDYVGKLVIGRIVRGSVRRGEWVSLLKRDKSVVKHKVNNVYTYEGLERIEVEHAEAGEIVALTGLSDASIGETVAKSGSIEALETIEVEQPTLTMNFLVNDSPLAGQEGKYVTSRKLRERLYKEVETNVALRVEDTASPDAFKVAGRGTLHLSILLETMRREGYELQVSRPEVILKTVNGITCEPFERLTCDIPERHLGTLMDLLGKRKGEMLSMGNLSDTQLRVQFKIPARGLIGFRSEFLTGTRGEGIMSHNFMGYEPQKGEVSGRNRGVIIAHEAGESSAYALFAAQERGTLFITSGVQVYEGMIVGESAREQDIEYNVCRKKQVTNIRSAGADEALRLVTPRSFSLEQALEYVQEDELVEITPTKMRMRKKYLKSHERARINKQEKLAKN